jgi:hypothetical protein
MAGTTGVIIVIVIDVLFYTYIMVYYISVNFIQVLYFAVPVCRASYGIIPV